MNAGRKEKSERRETKRVPERDWYGQKAQEMARGVEVSSREVADIGPQRVGVDEGSFHQREVDLSGLRSMQPSQDEMTRTVW